MKRAPKACKNRHSYKPTPSVLPSGLKWQNFLINPDTLEVWLIDAQKGGTHDARVSYQTSCGSPVAPKYRSPACRDAEIFIRQAC